MNQTIRLFLLFEAVTFVLAALIHAGVFISGYEHPQARIAEGVIAAALIAGLILSLVRPDWTRWLGLAAQGFALLGTLVGVFTIVIGVGPRTALDITYHIMILVVLGWGLIVTARVRSYVTG